MKPIVYDVFPDSDAEAAGIEKGDCIEKINGRVPEDELDFRFFALEDTVTLTVLKKDGSREIITIEEPESPDLGIRFESALFGKAKHCANKCIFCFIDQLPKGMRDTLYFKDDDARLSFLTGNYITLTNVKDADIEKILRMHLSPINISVHTTDPALRCKMLKNRHAGEKLRYMDTLAAHGISMNGQIVLVPGVNDGAALDKTISDLAKLSPQMVSVSVVPVGITKHREGLPKLDAFTKEGALEVLSQIENWQEKLQKEIGTRFVYGADEFYLLAERKVPPADAYEGYAQIENGVGLLRSLEDEFMEAMESSPEADARCVSIITGVAAAPLLKTLTSRAMEKFPQLQVDVFPIENTFFGEKITVAGLVTGQDILRALRGKDLGAAAYISESMLRSGTTVFLDDCTTEELSKALCTPIIPVSCDGYALWDALRKDEQI